MSHDKHPLRCNRTRRCVYNARSKKCMSAPGILKTMSKKAASDRLDEMLRKDYDTNPGFYGPLAATQIQRVRRGTSQRNPSVTTKLTLSTLDNKALSLPINSKVRIHGLKSLISRETGVPPSDMILMHESSEEPITTMEEVRSFINPTVNTLDLVMIAKPGGDIEEEIIELVNSEQMTGNRLRHEVMHVGFDRKTSDEGTPVVKGVTFEGWILNRGMANEHGNPDMLRLCEDVPTKIKVPNKLASYPTIESLVFIGAPIVSLPPSLGSLRNLVLLRLVTTLLKSLPASIGNLHSLKTLTIVDSCLSNKGIPKSFGDLKNLESLTIDNTPNLVIGDSITPNPRQPLRTGPDITPLLDKLTNLESLDLSGTSVGSLDTPSLRKLKHLDLNLTYLTAVPEWVYYLPHLEYFAAEGCYIQHFLDPARGQGAGIFPAIESIYLGGNPLTNQAVSNLDTLVRLRQ